MNNYYIILIFFLVLFIIFYFYDLNKIPSSVVLAIIILFIILSPLSLLNKKMYKENFKNNYSRTDNIILNENRASLDAYYLDENYNSTKDKNYPDSCAVSPYLQETCIKKDDNIKEKNEENIKKKTGSIISFNDQYIMNSPLILKNLKKTGIKAKDTPDVELKSELNPLYKNDFVKSEFTYIRTRRNKFISFDAFDNTVYMYLTNLRPGNQNPVYSKTKNDNDDTKGKLQKSVIFENRKEPQKWKIVPVDKCTNLALVYIMTADKPHFYLECDKNHNVTVSMEKSGSNQHWIIIPKGMGYNIISKHSGKYLSYSYVGRQLYKEQSTLMMSNDKRMIWFFNNSLSKIDIPDCRIKNYETNQSIEEIINGMYAYNNNVLKININNIQKNYISGELVFYYLIKNPIGKLNKMNKIVYKIKSLQTELDIQNNNIKPYIMTGELIHDLGTKKFKFINLRFIFNNNIELIPKIYNGSYEIRSLFPKSDLNTKAKKIFIDSECMIKIDGKCNMYPQLSDKTWFKDYEYGGGPPKDLSSCKDRKESWDKRCGVQSLIDMKFRENSKSPYKYDYSKKCEMEIKGNCKRYPNMSNRSWFNDNRHGGPKPSSLYACKTRQESWQDSCGKDTIVNMRYTNNKNESETYMENKEYRKWLRNKNNAHELGNINILPWAKSLSLFTQKFGFVINNPEGREKAKWISNLSNANSISPQNGKTRFTYMYRNKSRQNINVKIDIICDDEGEIYINNAKKLKIKNGVYNLIFKPGINKISVVVTNFGNSPNPSGMIAIIVDQNNKLLFTTNSEWKLDGEKFYKPKMKCSDNKTYINAVSNKYSTVNNVNQEWCNKACKNELNCDMYLMNGPKQCNLYENINNISMYCKPGDGHNYYGEIKDRKKNNIIRDISKKDIIKK